ncbi:MAG: glutamyl-Q tRNA(Asp) synthetase [Myxococcota bacterium]|nr:glutamyl-Q tRNA(Asp) synthetase [Myxococcota bacterium]MDW8362871.1 glutamyl-Q tRNA(Asp) synthetase [Myxococcales bacterium]
MSYRGRLAPSPTGSLHLGHARTFLVAWLRARIAGGALVLRIEDLDPPRVLPGAAARIVEDLRWLGLDWDEGPDVGGPYGPYVQSERSDRYAWALRRLDELGLLYPCTCTRREVQRVSSAPHEDDEEAAPRYPGTCRSRPIREDRPASLRFRDGDFIVRRADGLWAYQLAVAVDDGTMQITEVVRGADLLPCTPWQVALLRALELPVPRYLHVPLVRGPDGRRLSKRHGAVAIASMRQAGVPPQRVIGRLAASLGVVPEGSELSPRELLSASGIERLDELVARAAPGVQ